MEYKYLKNGDIPQEGDEEYRLFKWRIFHWYGDIVIRKGKPKIRRKRSEKIIQSRYVIAAEVLNEYKEECPPFPSGSFAQFIKKRILKEIEE